MPKWTIKKSVNCCLQRNLFISIHCVNSLLESVCNSVCSKRDAWFWIKATLRKRSSIQGSCIKHEPPDGSRSGSLSLGKKEFHFKEQQVANALLLHLHAPVKHISYLQLFDWVCCCVTELLLTAGGSINSPAFYSEIHSVYLCFPKAPISWNFIPVFLLL